MLLRPMQANVALMDSDVAKANAVPIIGYALGGEIMGIIYKQHFSGGIDIQLQITKTMGL